MKNLTARQKEVLNFIRTYREEHHYPPTIREIAGNFSISVKGAYDHVKALEKKGAIRSGSSKSRAIEIIEPEGLTTKTELLEIPILGSVAAGIPLFAEENHEGIIQLPGQILGKGPHFALKVKGDSMTNAGIMNGDLAVFRQQTMANNGDIVVARINDEAVTLKRFFREKNRIRLQAENPAYLPIFTTNVRILGRLQHLFRNYK